MWLHICLLVGTVLLAVMAITGRMPGGETLSAREWRILLLILTVGNGLGAWMTYAKNAERLWKEDMYFEKRAAGEGGYEEEMQAEIQGERTSVYVQVPEQAQDEEEDARQREESKRPQPNLDERIYQAVTDCNQEKEREDKYYLPAYLDGEPIVWSHPWDKSGGVLAVLSMIGACCIPLQKQRDRERKRQERSRQLLLDYPNLLTRLALLLEAGMTVRKAFERIALDYNRKKKEGVRYAYEELLKTYYEMESGVMEERAYENFGKRCGHPKYRTLATLLVQNLKKGNRQLLDTLEKESAEAFEERKRLARVQGEEAATKLLIPMTLMLVIVLVILIVPACLSFYQT